MPLKGKFVHKLPIFRNQIGPGARPSGRLSLDCNEISRVFQSVRLYGRSSGVNAAPLAAASPRAKGRDLQVA